MLPHLPVEIWSMIVDHVAQNDAALDLDFFKSRRYPTPRRHDNETACVPRTAEWCPVGCLTCSDALTREQQLELGDQAMISGVTDDEENEDEDEDEDEEEDEDEDEEEDEDEAYGSENEENGSDEEPGSENEATTSPRQVCHGCTNCQGEPALGIAADYSPANCYRETIRDNDGLPMLQWVFENLNDAETTRPCWHNIHKSEVSKKLRPSRKVLSGGQIHFFQSFTLMSVSRFFATEARTAFWSRMVFSGPSPHMDEETTRSGDSVHGDLEGPRYGHHHMFPKLGGSADLPGFFAECPRDLYEKIQRVEINDTYAPHFTTSPADLFSQWVPFALDEPSTQPTSGPPTRTAPLTCLRHLKLTRTSPMGIESFKSMFIEFTDNGLPWSYRIGNREEFIQRVKSVADINSGLDKLLDKLPLLESLSVDYHSCLNTCRCETPLDEQPLINPYPDCLGYALFQLRTALPGFDPAAHLYPSRHSRNLPHGEKCEVSILVSSWEMKKLLRGVSQAIERMAAVKIAERKETRRWAESLSRMQALNEKSLVTQVGDLAT